MLANVVCIEYDDGDDEDDGENIVCLFVDDCRAELAACVPACLTTDWLTCGGSGDGGCCGCRDRSCGYNNNDNNMRIIIREKERDEAKE